MNYSTEQAANIAVALGFILKLFKIEIATQEISDFVSAVLVLGGLGWSWYKRWKNGKEGKLAPVNVLGFRKRVV